MLKSFAHTPREITAETTTMTLADFSILYLSLGAPVATVAFLRAAKPGKRLPFAHALSAWLVWPAVAIYLVGKAPRRRAVLDLLDGGAQTSRHASARSSLISEFDATTISSMGAAETFAFRETLERYVALSELLENTISEFEDLPENEFFVAAKSEWRTTGTICLARRNKARLTRHLRRARMDLVNSMALLPVGEARLAARSALIRLFDSFGDADGKQAVSESISGNAAEPSAHPDIIKFTAV